MCVWRLSMCVSRDMMYPCYQWLPLRVGTVDEFPSLYVLNFIQMKMNNFIIIRISLSILIIKSVRKI